jgi:hypothetical protein
VEGQPPPPPPGQPPPPPPQQPGQWQPPAQAGGPQFAQAPAGQQRTPGKATAALVLGIIGIFILPIVCSTLAIIFGVQARNEIDRDPSLGGRGLATAGMVLGIVGIALGILWAVIVFS